MSSTLKDQTGIISLDYCKINVPKTISNLVFKLRNYLLNLPRQSLIRRNAQRMSPWGKSWT